MGRIEVLTGPERRRRWSDEEKLRILAEAEGSGQSVAAVARRHDLYPQQVYGWRRAFRRAVTAEAGEGPGVSFLPVEMTDEPQLPVCATNVLAEPQRRPPSRPNRTRNAEITLANGRRLRVPGTISAADLQRLVRALDEA